MMPTMAIESVEEIPDMLDDSDDEEKMLEEVCNQAGLTPVEEITPN